MQSEKGVGTWVGNFWVKRLLQWLTMSAKAVQFQDKHGLIMCKAHPVLHNCTLKSCWSVTSLLHCKPIGDSGRKVHHKFAIQWATSISSEYGSLRLAWWILQTADSQTWRLTTEIIYGWNALFFADNAHATNIKRTKDGYWMVEPRGAIKDRVGMWSWPTL